MNKKVFENFDFLQNYIKLKEIKFIIKINFYDNIYHFICVFLNSNFVAIKTATKPKVQNTITTFS